MRRALALGAALAACTPGGPAGPALSPPATTLPVLDGASLLPPRPPDPPPAPPRPIAMPSVSASRLASGVELVVIGQRDLPLVAFEVLVDAGGLDDRPGVAQLTAALVAAGAGAADRDPGDLERALAGAGGAIEVVVGPRHTSYRLEVPREHLANAVQLLGEMLSLRALRQKGFTALRAQAMATADARAGDEPRFIAREILLRELHGGDPASREAVLGTWKELSRIRHAHCETFYLQRYVAPATLVLVAGDVEASAITPLLERAFDGYPPRQPPAASPRKPDAGPLSIYLVDHPGAPTSLVSAAYQASGSHASFEVTAALARRSLGTALDGDVDAEALVGQALAVEVEVARDATLGAVHALLAAPERLAAVDAAQRNAARRDARARLLEELGRASSIAALARRLRAAGEPASSIARHAQALDAADAALALAPATAVVVVGDATSLAPALQPVADVVLLDARDGFDTVKSFAKQPGG